MPCCIAGQATGGVKTSITAVGRYKVEVACAKGSEATYFNAIFSECTLTQLNYCVTLHLAHVCPLYESTVQPPHEGKEITATAFPWSTSAYVSFSSHQSEVSFTCKLDTE